MIRLSANLAKKVPLPGVEFSSQQYGAGMEIELGDATDAPGVARKLQGLYALLERSIDTQIEAAAPSRIPASPEGSSPGSNGALRRNGHASPAQIRAIFAICKEHAVSRETLGALLREGCGAQRVEELTIEQASALIGRLPRLALQGRYSPGER